MDENKKSFRRDDEDDIDKWLERHSADNLDFLGKKDNGAAQPIVTPPASEAHSDRVVIEPDDEESQYPVDRRDIVRRFAMSIDESKFDEDEPEPITEEAPRSKGEIYFSNHERVRRVREAAERYEAEQQTVKASKPDAPKAQHHATVTKVKQPLGFARGATMILIIVLLSSLMSITALSCMNDVLAINRNDEIVSVTIPQGASYKEIIDILADKNLVHNAAFCKFFARFRDYDEVKFLNGVYYLSSDMGCEGMLNEVRQVQKTAETVSLSFPEGWTISQIVEKLSKFNVCRADHFYSALSGTEFDYDFVKNIPQVNGRYLKLEGYMFPDTYEFYVGENVNSVIRKFLTNFDSKWTDGDEKRAKEIGFSMDQILTIASIVEKEAANKEQMAQISSVIYNRLGNSVNHPSLGCDSTKNYIQNYVLPVVGSSAANVLLEYYDTSVCSGLPAGPICNPGRDAINAALNPADTDYFYFCHDNNGKIYLANTYNEHLSNWSEVLKVNAK